jgi:hypothetical protein
MSVMWLPRNRGLALPEDPGAPDDAEEHLRALRPVDHAVSNALLSRLRARRALLREPQPERDR